MTFRAFYVTNIASAHAHARTRMRTHAHACALKPEAQNRASGYGLSQSPSISYPESSGFLVSGGDAGETLG